MMSQNSLLKHLDHIESRVRSFGAAAQIAFAAAGVERLRPMFHQGCELEVWQDLSRAAFDGILQQLWRAVEQGESHLEGDLHGWCADLIPDNLELHDGPRSMLFTVANALRDLIDSIYRGECEYAYLIGARNLDLIEFLADEVESDLEALQMVEVERQIRDINFLEEAPAPGLGALRKVNVNLSVYDTEWFHP